MRATTFCGCPHLFFDRRKMYLSFFVIDADQISRTVISVYERVIDIVDTVVVVMDSGCRRKIFGRSAKNAGKKSVCQRYSERRIDVAGRYGGIRHGGVIVGFFVVGYCFCMFVRLKFYQIAVFVFEGIDVACQIAFDKMAFRIVIEFVDFQIVFIVASVDGHIGKAVGADGEFRVVFIVVAHCVFCQNDCAGIALRVVETVRELSVIDDAGQESFIVEGVVQNVLAMNSLYLLLADIYVGGVEASVSGVVNNSQFFIAQSCVAETASMLPNKAAEILVMVFISEEC